MTLHTLRHSRGLAVAGLALALAACTVDGEPEPAPTPTTSDAALPIVDEDAERLSALVEDIRTTVAALRTTLETAAADGDTDALEAAATLLVADVEAATTVGAAGEASDVEPVDPDTEDAAPLLPGPVVSREESVLYGDLLTRTLATARSAGGDGELVQRFLADPLAGDLGAWQRAPDDQLDAIARAGTTSGLDDAGIAILELDGDAPRALAWVVHGLAHPADAADAAGRALAHLAVIDLALEQLP